MGTSRPKQAAWDLGHIVFFYSLASIYLYFFSKKIKYYRSVLVFASFFIGLSVELIQVKFNRSFSSNDILFDMFGVFLALLFPPPPLQGLRISALIKALILVSITGLSLWKLVVVSYDEYLIYQNNFMLSDGKVWANKYRWSSDLQLKSVKNETASGLMATLTTDRWCGLSLEHFHRNWSEYNTLNAVIFSHSKMPIPVYFQVFDRQHVSNGYKYEDRNVQEIVLAPGKNVLQYDIDALLQTPSGRIMDKQLIWDIAIFSEKLNQPATIVVEEIFLTR